MRRLHPTTSCRWPRPDPNLQRHDPLRPCLASPTCSLIRGSKFFLHACEVRYCSSAPSSCMCSSLCFCRAATEDPTEGGDPSSTYLSRRALQATAACTAGNGGMHCRQQQHALQAPMACTTGSSSSVHSRQQQRAVRRPCVCSPRRCLISVCFAHN